MIEGIGSAIDKVITIIGIIVLLMIPFAIWGFINFIIYLCSN